MRYLLDTDWAIYYLRRKPAIVEQLDALFPEGVGISIISVAELYVGAAGAVDPVAGEVEVSKFLSAAIRVVELDADTCRIFAREQVRLRRSGNLIPDFDLLIGATALRHNFTLLSNNRRHFERIAGLNIISV